MIVSAAAQEDQEDSSIELPIERLDTVPLSDCADSLGIHLNEAQLAQFREYWLGLIAWNELTNLTTVTDWDRVIHRHFVESLAAADAIPAKMLTNGKFVDVGSGAGFPGIPLKIAFPSMRGALVEATRKKVDFLRWIAKRLELSELEAYHARAETMARDDEFRESFDLVFARAVAPMPILAELTLPLCRIGGSVVLHKTLRAAAEELDAARYAIDALGGEIRKVSAQTPKNADSDRALVILQKTGETPSRYPRRPGMPAKRPLLRP